MRKFILSIVFGTLALLIAYLISNQYVHLPKPAQVSPPTITSSTIPKIIAEKSTIGGRENPRARSAYEEAMLVDPSTGTIPSDIKRREYRFSSTIPKRRNLGGTLRTGGTNEAGWKSIGPFNKGGRTRALAIDVTDEKIILAGGVSGGMWRSEDDGSRWTKTTVPSSIHSVSCIAQDLRAGKENIWYYGTGEFTSNSASKKRAPFRGDGVFKSNDGGITWTQLASTSEGVPNFYNSQFQYIWKVLPNSHNLVDDEVFLATVGAILRSTDGGESWDLVLGRKENSTPETDLNDATVSDFADIVQTENGIYYAVLSQRARNGSSSDQGIYRSADGVSWNRITPRSWPDNYARTVMATSKTAPNEIYFSVNAEEEMLWKYTYISGNGTGAGGNWENLSANIPSFGGKVGDYDSQDSYNMVLLVHPDDKDVVFLGGTNLYRNTDGFSSDSFTTWIGGYDTANNIKIYLNHFVDQHALVCYPSNPNKMLSSNDGGVFVTEDNTATNISWRPLNHGFVTTQFYSVGLDEFGNKGAVMGGLQDNGSLISNKPIDLSSWNAVLTGDGGYSAISKNSTYYFASYQFGNIYRFTFDKNLTRKSFTRVDPLGSGGELKLLFVNPYVLAPENQNVMYYAGGDVVWKNSNISQIPLFRNHQTQVNWEKITETQLVHPTIITAINASYNPSGTVYYGTNDGRLYRIRNASENNSSVEEITAPAFEEGAYVSSIAIDRKDSRNIAVSFSNYNVISVFASSDGGDTFVNISGNLEENPDGSGSGPSVRWIEIVSKNSTPSQYFVGTSTGIYSTEMLEGNSTTWLQEGSGSLGNVLVTMIKYFSGDGTIVAATHGNGMYEASLDNVWKIEINQDEFEFDVGDAFPNPFTSATAIPFSIPEDGMVKAGIYTMQGQLIKTILWAELFKGNNMLSWDGTNEAGTSVVSGMYLCRIQYMDQNLGSRLVFTP